MLTREGFDVITAASGRQGIQLAREVRPRLITLDVLMPERDGWSTLQELKRDESLMVKRIALSPAARGVTIKSDNPSYPEWRERETWRRRQVMKDRTGALDMPGTGQAPIRVDLGCERMFSAVLDHLDGVGRGPHPFVSDRRIEGGEIDEAHRLTDLVNDLLDLSRLQSGAQTPNPEPLNLTEMIRGIMGRYAKLVLHDGYTITLEAGQDAMVMADRLRMTQVLYNLINNAINYAGEDRMVLVRQTVEHGAVKVEVIDHGEGIDAENLPYVWDRYYKVDKNHRRSAVGAGLGLSIVKGVLEAHGAEYGVASTVGRGSDFWFRLPLLEQQDALSAQSEENSFDFS